MKKINLLFCSIIMALLLCSNALANDDVETKQVTFEQFIIPYFESNNTQVFDRAGNNITQEFFAKNTSYYLAGDFDSIKNYSYAKVGRFKDYKESVVSTKGFNETRYIEYYEAPYINYSNGPAHNLSTRASISPDKFYATFSATMTILGRYDYSIIVYDENMGAITATIRGDASGVVTN